MKDNSQTITQQVKTDSDTDMLRVQPLPNLLSAKLMVQEVGLARSMVYQLLNRADMPVIKIGTRKFMHRDKFLEWLQTQAGE